MLASALIGLRTWVRPSRLRRYSLLASTCTPRWGNSQHSQDLHGVQVSDLELASLDKLLLTAEAQRMDRSGGYLQITVCEQQSRGEHQYEAPVAPASTGLTSSSMAPTRQAACLAQPGAVRWSSAAHASSRCPATDHMQHQQQQQLTSNMPLQHHHWMHSNQGSVAGERSDQPQSTMQDASQHGRHQLDHIQPGSGPSAATEAGLGSIAERVWSATAGQPAPSVLGSSAHQQEQQQQQQQGTVKAHTSGSELSTAEQFCCGVANQSAQPSSLLSMVQQHALGLNPSMQQLNTHSSAGSLDPPSAPAASRGHDRSHPAANPPSAAVENSIAEQPGYGSVAGSRADQKGPRPGTGRQHARKQHSGRRLPASMDASRTQPPREPEMPFLRFTVSCTPGFKPVLHPSRVS